MRVPGRQTVSGVLLGCGIVAPLLYVAMTLFVGRLWPGYSSTSQTISELSAIGAPTRALWAGLITIYTALMIAFGCAAWMRATDNRSLHVVAALLIAQGIFGLFWPPMHMRPVLAAEGRALTDTLHILWTVVSSVIFILILGFGSTIFGKRFRAFSILTIVIVIASGAWTGTYASRIESNLPTPAAGVWERIDTTAYMMWIAALAIMLLRAQAPPASSARPPRSIDSAAA